MYYTHPCCQTETQFLVKIVRIVHEILRYIKPKNGMSCECYRYLKHCPHRNIFSRNANRAQRHLRNDLGTSCRAQV